MDECGTRRHFLSFVSYSTKALASAFAEKKSFDLNVVKNCSFYIANVVENVFISLSFLPLYQLSSSKSESIGPRFEILTGMIPKFSLLLITIEHFLPLLTTRTKLKTTQATDMLKSVITEYYYYAYITAHCKQNA